MIQAHADKKAIIFAILAPFFSHTATIGKARVGALTYVSQLIEPSLANMIPLMLVFVLSLTVAAVLLALIYKKLKYLFKINTQILYVVLLVYLTILVFLISGPLGIATLAAGTAVGSLPLFLGTKRVHVMGVIIIPSILLML